jgi:hypothetical protein
VRNRVGNPLFLIGLGAFDMLIQCTKKLLSELKVEPSVSLEEEALFSWHANMITVNRRKTLVLMNDSNRYIIVLHGLKAKDLKKLDELILKAISETFRDEGIKDEVIEAFISQSKEISYTTTKNRTLVARLNKACESVYFYGRELNPDMINQSDVNKQASRFLVGNGKNDYIRPNQELYLELEKLVGGNIFHSDAFILHVKLNLENHPVWRRIIAPKHITFPELHETLQIVFGWKDSHLHDFTIFPSRPVDLDRRNRMEKKRNPIVNLVCHEEAFSYDYGIPMKLETGERLLDYLPAEIIYNYDFGDDWEHEILLENVIDSYEVNYPVCLAGEGNTPPEDVGGEPGYEEFLAIMADPTHPDYSHMKSWSRSQGYEDFDIDMVNRRLKFM